MVQCTSIPVFYVATCSCESSKVFMCFVCIQSGVFILLSQETRVEGTHVICRSIDNRAVNFTALLSIDPESC